ncbi:hypothetical protein GCM10009083_22820 [Halopseudomonas pertucinogena]|uniref:Uncharacterized protein n=1 Tax=Halopseudomonas pertucinogena TaxID=86175 RepID=A0ABQ2CRB5_9GAMM|nr:hypothetical protein GCM10009083_22820 [Halopseudomonas pertucinogena]
MPAYYSNRRDAPQEATQKGRDRDELQDVADVKDDQDVTATPARETIRSCLQGFLYWSTLRHPPVGVSGPPP